VVVQHYITDGNHRWYLTVLLCEQLASIFCYLGWVVFPTAAGPPWITKHPPYEKAYKLGDRMELPCKADGSPSPTWDDLVSILARNPLKWPSLDKAFLPKFLACEFTNYQP